MPAGSSCRDIKRGELPENTSVTMMLDALFGAVVRHAMVAPTSLRQAQQAQADAFTERLVDFVLRGVRVAL